MRRDPALAEMMRIARILDARMMRDPGGGVATATIGGSGSGLPSGGSIGQAVINTGPGTGSWQNLPISSVASAEVGTNESTASLSYVDLATVGPTVTVTVPASGSVLIVVSAGLYNSATTANNSIAYSATGANTIGNSEILRFTWGGSAGSLATMTTAIALLTGLTPGSTTFKLQYDVSAGTGNFFNRVLTVIGLAGGVTGGSGGTSPLVPVNKTTAYTAVANDWVLADTTGGTFAVTLTAIADQKQLAVTWKAGAVAPTFAGTGILGSPTFGAPGNTVYLQYSTLAGLYLVL